MNNSLTDTESMALTLITFLLISCGVFFYLKPWKVEQMYVIDKQWRYTVEECEDYTTTKCENKCTKNNDNTENCRIVCTTTTHTRVLNTWKAEGNYKTEPYWPTYTIRPAYYERRSTWYAVWFKNDDRVQPYKAWNYNDYTRLKYENVYTVTTNIFGIATKVE